MSSDLITSLPKHAEIANYVRQAIGDGKLKAGDPIASEMELCRIFNASRSPVRRALEELESQRLIRRERGVGTFVAEPLQSSGAGVKRLSVVFDSSHNFPNDFILAEVMQALAQAEKTASGFSFKLQLEFHAFSGAQDEQALQMLSRAECDGMLIVGFRQSCTDFLNELKSPRIPLVSFFAQVDNPRLNSIWIDQAAGAYQATELLQRFGHRSIALVRPAFVDGPDERNREKGFRWAMAQAGVSEPVVVRTGAENLAAAAPLRALLAEAGRPSALLVAGGLLHRVVAEAISAEGLRVPDDISVIGIDATETARLMTPPWVVVRQPIAVGIRQALDRLLGLVYHQSDKPQQDALKPELILRESIRPL